MAMVDSGSSITLIFYKIGSDWYKGGEPLLNLIAAAAQGSVFTHIEIAIGEAPGDGGRMSNVLRVCTFAPRSHGNQELLRSILTLNALSNLHRTGI